MNALTAKINREIFRLAGPNILSNISVPLISSVDTALMGHLSSTHLGAIGLGAMLFNFLYWNFGFLRMGTTGTTAQAYGAKDKDQIITTMIRALLVALSIALLLLLLKQPLSTAGYWMLNTPDTHLPLGMEYFGIRIWAAPATLALYVLMGWFFGMQNAYIPLILTIIINTVNIAISYYLVIHMNWEIAGVAWGTVIAQYIGVLAAIVFWLIRYRSTAFAFSVSGFWKWKAFKKFLDLNKNIFIRTLSLSFAFAFFYNRSAAFGALILDANVVLLQFLHWMSYGVDGFAYAAESLSGKYKGANEKSSFDKALQWCFLWGGVLAVIYAMGYGFAGDSLIALFTDQEEVQNKAGEYLIWMIILPLAGFASYIWDGIFVGMTAGISMRNSMVAALLVYLAVFLSVDIDWGNHGLWLSLMAFLLARAIFQAWLYYKKGWALK
jgi:MATE family multidrug resistance protein